MRYAAPRLSAEDKLEICSARCTELLGTVQDLRQSRDAWQAQASQLSLALAASTIMTRRPAAPWWKRMLGR